MTKKEKTDWFNSLSIDERKAYLETMEDVELKKFIKDISEQAIQDFWNYERELIKEGEGTRNWTAEQMEEIFKVGISGNESKNAGAALQYDENGVVVKDVQGNSAYYGHHMLNANDYPEYAGDYRNIQALKYGEHYDGAHGGNTHNPTNWYYDPNTKKYENINPSEVDFDNLKYPPKEVQLKGYNSDSALKSIYKDYDTLKDGQKLAIRMVDKVLGDQGTIEDLNRVLDRAKKYDADKISDIKIYIDKNKKIVSDNLVEIFGGTNADTPNDVIYSGKLTEINDMINNNTYKDKYPKYEQLDAMDKIAIIKTNELMQELQVVSNKIKISPDIELQYKTAIGKVELSEIDNLLIKIASGIKKQTPEATELFNITAQIDKLAPYAKKAGHIIGATDYVLDAVEGGMAIANAYKEIQNGNPEKAVNIIIDKGIDLIGGGVLTSSIAPSLVAFGGVVGGPLGMAIGGILAGVIGYGIADKIGNIFGNIAEQIVDMFRQAQVTRVSDPLILDLNGDNKFTTSLENGSYFDYDGEGFAEKTGWIAKAV